MTNAIDKPKTGADRLILGVVHERLDWIDTTSEACVSNIQALAKDGIIEGYRFRDLEVKVNGTWYKRP